LYLGKTYFYYGDNMKKKRPLLPELHTDTIGEDREVGWVFKTIFGFLFVLYLVLGGITIILALQELGYLI